MKKVKAFSLTELMIVVGLIGLLVSLGVPGFLRSRNKAWRDTCINNLRMIEHAADQYRIDNNLVIGTDVNIVWLWPTNSTAKDVSSYINKQLFCPNSPPAFYRGGANDGTVKATITANGLPHCVTAVGGTVKTNSGLETEHSIT